MSRLANQLELDCDRAARVDSGGIGRPLSVFVEFVLKQLVLIVSGAVMLAVHESPSGSHEFQLFVHPKNSHNMPDSTPSSHADSDAPGGIVNYFIQSTDHSHRHTLQRSVLGLSSVK